MTAFQVWDELTKEGSLGIQKRIAATSPLKIYGCIDFEGRRGMRFQGSWTAAVLPELEFISIRVQPSGSGVTLEVFLSDEALFPLFQVLSDDLVKAATAETASLNTVLDRMLHWQTMLSDAKRSEISLNRVRGLVGELLVLKRLCSIIGVPPAIATWSGPLRTPQDFYWSSTCLEVKTVGPGAKRVQIQAAEQLEPSYLCDLYLCVVILGPGQAATSGVVSLAALIENFQSDLALNPEIFGEFIGRLQGAGWREDLELNAESFEVLSLRLFKVSDGFPRLRSTEIPPGVSFVRYELELAAIKSFEVHQLPGESR